jgi:hypothetical protein
VPRDGATQWKFSSPISPWQGGFFERLVGMIKAHLPLITSRATFNQQELQTIVTEVEAVLNSRPIGSLENGMVLTPGHLLIGRRPLSWPGLREAAFDQDAVPKDVWYRRECALDEFWNSWRKTYLATLRGRFASGRGTTRLLVGSSVLLHDESVPRASWKVGIVRQVFPGPDGFTRNVVVEAEGKEYRRSIQRLSPLECDHK